VKRTLGRVVGVLTLAAGCITASPSLPTAPSELASGIVVYEHESFRGASAHITADVPNLSNFKGPCEHTVADSSGSTDSTFDWNECISSVRVAPGWSATLYRGADYKDDSITLTEDHSNLQTVTQHDCPQRGLNDCVSSIRVQRRP
jgi:hypothetical protein